MSPFFFLALLAMIVDWVGRLRSSKPLEYIGKPLAIVFLLAWLVQRTLMAGGAGWFAIALAFSLVGDILLMLPSERFIGGLAAFFLAHLAYIVGFNLLPARFGLPTFGLAAVLVALGAWVYARLSAGVRAIGKPALQAPLLLYSIVLAAMLFSAVQCLSRPAWGLPPALLVSLGAGLFFLSDTLHAWNRFVRPLWLGRTLVHVTYHLAQLGIAAGVILHYSGSLAA
jgi:uncharacterized membrane protein YhhN